MTQTSQWQFGLILAYLIPGFIGLAGVAPIISLVGKWLAPVSDGSLDLGPTVYAALAAIAVGMILSCFRWLLVDRLHGWTGVKRPVWNDQKLHGNLGSFDYLVQNHFRYYEFCGNTMLALLWAYGVNRALGTSPYFGLWTDISALVVVVVLFAASRDALVKYYTRTTLLLGAAGGNIEKGEDMFNGNDHGSTKKSASQSGSGSKSKDKSQKTAPSKQGKSEGEKTGK
jgi:hypothetical protein